MRSSESVEKETENGCTFPSMANVEHSTNVHGSLKDVGPCEELITDSSTANASLRFNANCHCG